PPSSRPCAAVLSSSPVSRIGLINSRRDSTRIQLQFTLRQCQLALCWREWQYRRILSFHILSFPLLVLTLLSPLTTEQSSRTADGYSVATTLCQHKASSIRLHKATASHY